MKAIKRLVHRLFNLPPLATVLVAVPSFALLIFVFFFGLQDNALAYAAYLASAYALAVTVTGVCRAIKKLRLTAASHPAIQKLREQPLVERFSSDALFRADVSLYRGMLINLLYAVFKLAAALRYASVWFGAVSVYTFTLCGIRFYLAKASRNASLRQEKERRCYELQVCCRTGFLMLFLTIAMLGMVLQMVLHNRSFQYPGTVIYASAFYTFYSLISAIVYAVRARELHRPTFSAAKVLNLDSAFMSLLTLQTAMLAQFGEGDAAFRQIMNLATGTVVILFSATLAVLLIVRASRTRRTVPPAQDVR